MARVNNVNWMIGGAQGSGVDLAAGAFARSCVLAGLWLFGTREYYSNIKGLHSYFGIRVSSENVQSKVDGVDLLATFDEETLIRHAESVNADGGIIYDSALVKTPIEEVDTIYKSERRDFLARLSKQGLGTDVEAILEEARMRGVKAFPVPYTDLLRQTAKDLNIVASSNVNRIINILAVSASLTALGLDGQFLEEAVRQSFSASRKQKLVDMNVTGARIAHGYVKDHSPGQIEAQLSPMKSGPKLFMVGNQAVALGKMVGGCRMQTYYPITPASDESEFLEAHETFALQDGGSGSIVVAQTEDEIAAVTMATSGALAGARTATSTSGPGFSLMTEGLGWAGINEVPLVVTLYSRGGPSTGLPTRTEQGDLKFVLNASHGEFPRIVVCSGDIEECFYDAIRAMNYAERYQLPVIHMVDKGLANSNQTVPPLDPNLVSIDRGKLIPQADGGPAKREEEYKRFAFAEDGVSPRAVLGQKEHRFWNTGDEHDELGHINENPQNRIKMMTKRMSKLETADREIPDSEKVRLFSAKGSPAATIVSWGSSKGAIVDAMSPLQKAGIDVEFLQLRMVSPFPTELVRERLSKAKLAIDIEQNYSAQMAAVIAEKTQIRIRNRIVKFNGRPISQDEIYDSIRQVVSRPEANQRVVLSGGA